MGLAPGRAAGPGAPGARRARPKFSPQNSRASGAPGRLAVPQPKSAGPTRIKTQILHPLAGLEGGTGWAGTADSVGVRIRGGGLFYSTREQITRARALSRLKKPHPACMWGRRPRAGSFFLSLSLSLSLFSPSLPPSLSLPLFLPLSLSLSLPPPLPLFARAGRAQALRTKCDRRGAARPPAGSVLGLRRGLLLRHSWPCSLAARKVLGGLGCRRPAGISAGIASARFGRGR